ncbi:MAG: ubiquinol-cytochrome c reductase iron-sulfur subunit [Bryobacteraceae bacterium]
MATPPTTTPPKADDTAKKPAPGVGDVLRRLFAKTPEPEGDRSVIMRRRRFVMAAVLGSLGVNFLMFLRFFFPRALFEPKTRFKIGYPSDFSFGVDTKFQNQYRIWVVRNTEGIFVISAICTHLGCTPDWKPGENKFKCPCHGSGYDSEGVNLEGPAPRPMDRANVEIDADGQILVDLAQVYKWPKGERSQFGDEGAIIRL